MIILLYLIVISGWALLILLIKCRKAREKRIAMEQQQGMTRIGIFGICVTKITINFLPFSAQIQNAVHVIQIGNSFYDVIPISRCSHSHSRCRGFHIRNSESNSSLSQANSHVNPSFILEEGVYPSGRAFIT